MNIQTVNKDIQLLEKALKLVELTENYLHFERATIMLHLCEQINVLKEKRDRQLTYLRRLS